MKRLVRFKLDFIVEIDDSRSGIPFVKEPHDLFDGALSRGLPSLEGRKMSILLGGKLEMSLIKIVNGKIRGVTGYEAINGRTVKKPDRRAKERRMKPRRLDDKSRRMLADRA